MICICENYKFQMLPPIWRKYYRPLPREITNLFYFKTFLKSFCERFFKENQQGNGTVHK